MMSMQVHMCRSNAHKIAAIFLNSSEVYYSLRINVREYRRGNKNGQSRKIDNNGSTRHRTKTKKTTPLYASKHK